MDKEEMLYNKMVQEQNEFRGQLLSMEPKQILEKSYEYCIREDILKEMEFMVLYSEQVDAIYELDKPLAAIYKKFDKMETEHMIDIQNAIRFKANDLINSKNVDKNTVLKFNNKKAL